MDGHDHGPQNTESIPSHSVNLPSTLAIVGGPMALTIMADDLTGACDAGTLFAGRAPVPVTVWPAAPVVAEVAVVDTESRHIDREAASARVSGAAASRPAARSRSSRYRSSPAPPAWRCHSPRASASARGGRRCRAGGG